MTSPEEHSQRSTLCELAVCFFVRALLYPLPGFCRTDIIGGPEIGEYIQSFLESGVNAVSNIHWNVTSDLVWCRQGSTMGQMG